MAFCYAKEKNLPAHLKGQQGLGDVWTWVAMTSDGLKAYLEAVEYAFGSEIDYAQLIKLYGNEVAQGEARYSPPVCIGARKKRISGSPRPEARFNEHGRASKSDHAHGDAPLYQAHQWILKEA